MQDANNKRLTSRLKTRLIPIKSCGNHAIQDYVNIACQGSFPGFLGFPGGYYPRHATVLIHCVHGEGGLGPSGPRPALAPKTNHFVVRSAPVISMVRWRFVC